MRFTWGRHLLRLNLRQIGCVFAFSILAPIFALALTPGCSSLFQESEHNTDWRSESNLYQALRSNPAHYWGWLKQNNFSKLFSVKGVVIGDPHLYNFGAIVQASKKIEFGLVDVDDSGVNAPLFADFLRLFIANQLSPHNLDKKDIWDAYLAGLNSKKMDKPDYIKEIENLSSEDIAKDQDEYLQDVTKKDRFTKRAGLTAIEDAPREVQKLYQEVKSDLEKEMSGYQILDSGFRMKTEGGSQFQPRFWFLISRGNELHIWEFKMEPEAGVASYTAQPDPNSRLNSVVEVYRPGVPLGPYRYIQAGANLFLVRERFSKLTGGMERLSKKEGKEVSLYIAYKMGLWQSQQASGKDLADMINKDPTTAFDEIKAHANQYIDLMKSENGK